MGVHIVFEGMDYTGKSTVAKDMVDRLNATMRYDAKYFREPNNEYIRDCIKTGKTPWSFSYLAPADHMHNLYEHVIPHLASSYRAILVQDRDYRISQMAYVLFRTSRVDAVAATNMDMHVSPRIDLLIHLTARVEVILERRKARAEVTGDVYDSMSEQKTRWLHSVYYGLMRSTYMAHHARAILEIDTSDLDLEHAGDKAFGLIRDYLDRTGTTYEL